MRNIFDKLRIALLLLTTLALSACLTDELADSNNTSSVDGLSISITNSGGASAIQTPDLAVNVTGTVSSKAAIESVKWLNDRGGKGNANGTDKWTTGNIVLQLGTNNITVTAKDIEGRIVSNTLTVEREDTTAPPDDSSAKLPVVMYSYSSNLTAAAPIKGASILPTSVYIFVEPGSDWENRGISRIIVLCCQGQSGPGQGEPYGAPANLGSSPWVRQFNMTGYAVGGTRRVRIQAEFSDGSKSNNPVFDFTVAEAAGGSNRPPVITGSPERTATVGNQYNFRPAATDPDGDTMQFSITRKPNWASFSTSTGRLFGTPGVNDVGEYGPIVISVSDGTTTRKLPSFSITVDAISNGRATLSWSIPTQRTDNTPLNNLAGFHIYYGQTPGDYGNKIKLTNTGNPTYMVENLSTGTWYFVVTAVDAGGLESNPSNRRSKSF